MAPLPLPERAIPTPAGYLAALKSTGKDASTSTGWRQPTIESRARALALMSEIHREQARPLAAWVQRRRRAKGRNEAMYTTIRRLCAHTLPLADQVSAVTLSSA
jgi:acyl-CoA reductase-like NAD-dependent aldehyde dehydrogenase